MSGRFKSLALHDVRLQWRYGIYLAYAFVTGFYIAALLFIAPYLPDWLPALIISTDPAVVGFFFLGALMLLEKAENTRAAIAITPVTAAHYLFAKTLTLTLMALTAVTVLTFFLHRVTNVPLLLLTVAIISVQFIGLGVPITGLFKTVTGYLMGSAGLLTPVLLPAGIALLDTMPNWALPYPPAAQFRLILVATGAASANAGGIAIMLAVSLLGAVGCQYWGWLKLRKEFGE